MMKHVHVSSKLEVCCNLHSSVHTHTPTHRVGSNLGSNHKCTYFLFYKNCFRRHKHYRENMMTAECIDLQSV